jgi:hypothetical protein
MADIARSKWIETEYGDTLLPVRGRAEARRTRVRIVTFYLKGKNWLRLRTFPWADVGFTPTPLELDELAMGSMDTVLDWVEQHEGELLNQFLAGEHS